MNVTEHDDYAYGTSDWAWMTTWNVSIPSRHNENSSLPFPTHPFSIIGCLPSYFLITSSNATESHYHATATAGLY